MSRLNQFVVKFPSVQNAFDIFEGLWTSRMPLAFGGGGATLSDDLRVIEFEKRLGSFGGLDILELGPLEGMQTMMMHNRGAAHITAVEANTGAFLRCLLVKDTFNLSRAQFLLGDFNQLLELQPKSYDYISAVGVLYHMPNPVKTIVNIAKRTNHVGIWTHFYDEVIFENDMLKHRFSKTASDVQYENFKAEGHRHSYEELLDWEGFCGGTEEFAMWLPADEWKRLLDELGFEVEVIFQKYDHPSGPDMLMFAKRKAMTLPGVAQPRVAPTRAGAFRSLLSNRTLGVP